MPPLPPRMDTLWSATQLAKRDITLPLQNVKEWSEHVDFQIDALGLVTLLGAEEVNLAIGSLQDRRYTRALPLLATFVVAGDRFTNEQPGFVLYNLSDGITSTELKGWFTRWLMNQSVKNATTVFTWKERDQPRRNWDLVAPVISFFLVAPLLVLAVLMGDWYGVGNTVAIILTIVTRLHILSQQRKGRDDLARPREEEEDKKKDKKMKTLCVVRSDGKMVTIHAPQSLVMTFVKGHSVSQPKLYKLSRRVAWLALGVHMLILGMCTLVTQIITVVLLVFSTWALSSDIDAKLDALADPPRAEDENGTIEKKMPFNDEWDVVKIDHPAIQDKRQVAWARLKLGDTEEAMMEKWNLFPYKNEDWRNAYEALKKNSGLPSALDEKQEPPVTSGAAAAQDSRPPITSMDSQQPLTQALGVPGTSGSSVSGTLTPYGSRSPSPGNVGDPGGTSTNPASSV